MINPVSVIILMSGLLFGGAMGLFESMTVNLFSEMQGVVTFHGEPVAGARITRLAIPASKEYVDSTETDASGRFSFERMTTRSFLKLLPGDDSVFQKIVIHYKGEEYVAWETGGASSINKGELNELDMIDTEKEIDINLICELSAPVTYKAGAHTTTVSGICTWEGNKDLDNTLI